MVVGAFPAAKLGALLLKQISKPIANVVKTQAKSSPVFRKYVCMPPAQCKFLCYSAFKTLISLLTLYIVLLYQNTIAFTVGNRSISILFSVYNWCEVKAKMWILNLGKPVNIPVLSEAMAIELGANLLGEGIIFIIAAGILISEYNRFV